ncbi:non-hydrolyzing UDP-N-acetylglucosamine 2-epimerase [Pedobacter faecalis]|uniref:non-hydrolyzing UDP-N-acetylglucosamine 2-epimerase n=1 Tax=Pedobacter faecalis TaxID=3041495 RepID=UPI00255042C7|nr:UDP-N-acetylglucosamine 2-epimerase (non-hydrolyzing) [Pedobacter sp. ELA7]
MKIFTIIGARPQFIKAAVVSRAIRSISGVTEVLIHTGQHFDANMSDVFFKELDIRHPDYNLKIGGGTHGQNTGRMLEAVESILMENKPDCVLVYGDTDSTLAGALAAVKLHIPLAHVEAGLRSFNRRMPEEINRVLTDHSSDLLFTPTETAVNNLTNEGVDANKVHLVGDVMLDATLYYKNKAKRPIRFPVTHGDFVLCTIHRAENTDDLGRLRNIIEALNEISCQVNIILPIHPRTANVISKFQDIKLNDRIFTIEPVGYLEMNWLLQHCSLVMTDSGGVQKEAFFHGKPCVTLRDETEWVELVNFGVNKLAPPNGGGIIDAFQAFYGKEIDNNLDLYGKGTAGVDLLNVIKDKL